MEYGQKDLLVDNELYLEQASSSKRFANYIIDVIVFYVIAIVIGILIALSSPETIESLDTESPMGSLTDRLISLVFFGIYGGIMEGLLKGRSIGKFITRTRAVNQDGTTISFGTAFIRGFSRAVPFNAFSALGTPCFPWHDRWSNTYVIDIKTSTLPDNIG
jgi:uncharacterized RDD family membrane protein YckC